METKRRFKFIGTEQNAKDYDCGDGKIPIVGKVYDEDEIFSEEPVKEWAKTEGVKHEWEEVVEQKNILSISGVKDGLVFSVSGDFEKCCRVLNFIYLL